MARPAGSVTVAPHMFGADCDGHTATGMSRSRWPRSGRSRRGGARADGGIADVQLRFGDSMTMPSDPADACPSGSVALYPHVADVDAAMAGAVAVADMPYGDRQSGLREPRGTIRGVSPRLTDPRCF